MSKEEAREAIRGLVSKLEQLRPLEAQECHEAKTRQGFVLPLFQYLGWDVFNIDEVVPEEAASRGRVDYAFKLNGVSRFYLEVKPLRSSLSNPNYVKQVITYAYSKGVTWAVLTNFRELRVFNAQASKAFITLTSENYLADFDRLWLLSRESTESGLFNMEAARAGASPLSVQPIEKRLFEQLRRWREDLFNQLLAYNQNLKLTQIDKIIQRLYNRLIFIRTCEDRGIEEKSLLAISNQWRSGGYRGEIVEHLREVFRDYDSYYDSDLFAVHAADHVFIESVMLESMIAGLYEIKGAMANYDFSLIDVDVLGAVYEQYLGHVASKVKEKAQAQLSLGITDDEVYKVISKKIHRKEQGIYYTPRFVTEYVISQTVGRLLKDQEFGKVNDIKVLDPACGSGSFLIRAYDALLNYHASEKGGGVDELGQNDRLPILTDCIFGVDLDMQAVEIARLNLLLRSLSKREKLPTLEANIRQGNSLISGTPDELEKYYGSDCRKKMPVDWDGQFKEVMAGGGFDVVIGNPPYGADLGEADRRYIDDHYPHSRDNKNSAMIFIEKGLSLTKEGGYFGFIVPKSLAYSQKWLAGREYIAEQLGCACDTSRAFKEVLLEQMVIIVSQKYQRNSYYLAAFLDEEGLHDQVAIARNDSRATDTILLGITEEEMAIFKKMTASNVFLRDISRTARGLPFQRYLVKSGDGVPIHRGDDISRYRLRANLETIPDEVLGHADQKVSFLQQPKIMSQQIVAHVQKPTDHIVLMSTLDELGILTLDTVQNTVLTDKNYELELVTALLNSTLWSWYAYRFIFSKAIRTMHFDGYYMGKFPLPDTSSLESDGNKAATSILSSKVKRMLELNRQMEALRDEYCDEKAELRAEIMDTDMAIDDAVYALYGLSESEVNLVTSGSGLTRTGVL